MLTFYSIFTVNTAGSHSESNGLCSANHKVDENCDGQNSSKDWLSVGIIFVGIFTVGIGSTSIFSFGIPYIVLYSKSKRMLTPKDEKIFSSYDQS